MQRIQLIKFSYNIALNVDNIVRRVISKIKWAIRRHGFFGVLSLAGEFILRLRPSVRTKIKEREKRAVRFDERYNVDTAGYVHLTELNIASENKIHAVGYGGSDPIIFQNAIETLQIDYSRFVFIDFGSGKGRTLLMASQFPFKKIVGVEFSYELHRVAENNIKRIYSKSKKCDEIESICIDAVDYKIPDDCFVGYFCNPFNSKVMNEVISNISKSLMKYHREVFLVYYNPREIKVIEQSDYFKKIKEMEVIHIWQSNINQDS